MGATSEEIIKHEIIPFLSPQIKDIFMQMDAEHFNCLEEIRLRCGQPLMLKIGDQDWPINCQGELQKNPEVGYQVQEGDIQSQYSRH